MIAADQHPDADSQAPRARRPPIGERSTETGPYPADAVLLAPMAGYTDLPFRRVCRLFGCRFAFTPLVSARAAVYGNPRTGPLIARGDDEPWLGLQIEGEAPEILAEAARRLDPERWEVIDMNMGCPVPKVTKKGSGAALGEDPERAARCIEALVPLAPGRVTTKIRILHEEDPAPTIRLVRMLRDAGAAAVTIHARTRERYYSGPPAAHVIRAVVQEVDGIQVIANGGVRSRETACLLRRESGCTRIMVARGAVGNPWIFREIQDSDAGRPPDTDEICRVLRLHVEEMVRFHGEHRGMLQARKIIPAYLKGRGFSAVLRREASFFSRFDEFLAFIERLRTAAPRIV